GLEHALLQRHVLAVEPAEALLVRDDRHRLAGLELEDPMPQAAPLLLAALAQAVDHTEDDAARDRAVGLGNLDRILLDQRDFSHGHPPRTAIPCRPSSSVSPATRERCAAPGWLRSSRGARPPSWPA